MAQSIVFNNATYIIPDVGESNWGQNLTNFFVAIPQGAYQASGGTLPLTADLSFGTNFGLFAKYLTSTTSNPSTTGVIRLANTEAVSWRNAGHSADLALAVNASNQLTFNGNVIPTDTTTITAKSFLYGDAAGLIASTSNPTNGQLLIGSTGNIPAVSTLTGTTNQVIVTNGVGTITLSTPQDIGTGSGPTFDHITLAKTTNQIILGTTNTVTISSTAPASSRVYTLPDAGGAANIVLDAGNYTIAGTWSFSNSITLASSKAVIFTDNSTNTVTMKATNSTTSWIMSLPTTHGSSNQFLQTDGSGNTTWANGGSGTVASGTAGNLTLYTGTGSAVGDTWVQNTHNIQLAIAAQGSRSANLVYTIPNPGNAVTADTFALLGLAQTFSGVNTFSGGAGAITMSSSTIAMGSNKITGLAQGSNSGDALSVSSNVTINAAGYLIGTVVQRIQLVDSNPSTSTSTSGFPATTTSQAITPKASTHVIRITISGTAIHSSTGTDQWQGCLLRGGSRLGNSQGMVNFGSASNSASQTFSVSFTYLDSPATTSSTTYAWGLQNGSGARTVTWGAQGSGNNELVLLLEEIAA